MARRFRDCGGMIQSAVRLALGLAAAWLTFAGTVAAQTVADRKGSILKDRENLLGDPRWIYNDFDRGFAEATRTGKPLLVVLRCVPCLACAGLDSSLLLENSALAPILDQFVCVRVINANALDLTRFEFDFDLSFTSMIFNGDGTVYGRYGSWTHQKNPLDRTTDGIRETLERALDLHRNYPANRIQLTGKQARPSTYKTPVDMPTLQGKYRRNLDWENNVVQSCVHCHQIGDALRAGFRERKERIPDRLIHPFPAPETVGIRLDLNKSASIDSVIEGSPASEAGLQPGDDILQFDDQPMISAADVSWVLHNAPDHGPLALTIRRDGTVRTLTLSLPTGWRHRADISRRVGTWSMRAMALGGLQLIDLADEERMRLGISMDRMALVARHVGEYNEHAAAKRAGFKKGDILVEVSGFNGRTSESELISQLLRERQAGDKVSTVVLRGEDRVELQLPIQ